MLSGDALNFVRDCVKSGRTDVLADLRKYLQTGDTQYAKKHLGEYLFKSQEYDWINKCVMQICSAYAYYPCESPDSFGVALKELFKNNVSVENRVVRLLESRGDDVFYNVMSLVRMFKQPGITFNYNNLLKQLIFWKDKRKLSQDKIASDFWIDSKNKENKNKEGEK